MYAIKKNYFSFTFPDLLISPSLLRVKVDRVKRVKDKTNINTKQQKLWYNFILISYQKLLKMSITNVGPITFIFIM